MSPRRFFLLPIVAVLWFGVVSPWVVPVSAAPPFAPHATILRFGLHVSAMGNLDPHFAAGSQDRALADLVFNGLLRYRPGNAPEIEPDLAEHIPGFSMVAGRQVWTIRLRRGVLFHPGPLTESYELTAEDVVFSLQKSARKESCAYAGAYQGMTVAAVDRYTVTITLDKPLSSVLFLPKLTNYAGGFIVSKRAMEAMGHDGFGQHPVGTGPFVFSRYIPGEALELIAHGTYFRGTPRLDGIQFRFVPDIQQRQAALLAGELDVITGSGEKGWPEEMARYPGIAVDTHGVGEVATIYLNSRSKPLSDIRVRHAIALALDREMFMATMSTALIGPVYSPVPSYFLPGGLTKRDTDRYGIALRPDLAKANQLMAAAGYPNGFTLDLVTSEKRLYRTYYQEMRRQLMRIGIRCRIAVETHAGMHRTIRRDPKPIVVYVAWRPNADAYLSRFFHSDAIVVSGTKPDTNFSHYRAVDRLIEAARLEIDAQRQIHLWKQAQIRILKDMVAFPIMYSKQCYARRDTVDYGHPLISTMALYPQFTEQTRLIPIP